MKRDLFIAIILGFVAGAVISISIITLPTLLSRQKSPSNKTVMNQIVLPTDTPTPSIQPANGTLAISQPADESVSDKPDVTVDGTSLSGATIVIQTNSDIQTTIADKNGAFSQDITLSEGENPVIITSYSPDMTSLSKTITLYFTSEKL